MSWSIYHSGVWYKTLSTQPHISVRHSSAWHIVKYAWTYHSGTYDLFYVGPPFNLNVVDESVCSGGTTPVYSAGLTWSLLDTSGTYNNVLVYRDGGLIATLGSTATSYTDSDPSLNAGNYAYNITATRQLSVLTSLIESPWSITFNVQLNNPCL